MAVPPISARRRVDSATEVPDIKLPAVIDILKASSAFSVQAINDSATFFFA
jgi:hypothetical protein